MLLNIMDVYQYAVSVVCGTICSVSGVWYYMQCQWCVVLYAVSVVCGTICSVSGVWYYMQCQWCVVLYAVSVVCGTICSVSGVWYYMAPDRDTNSIDAVFVAATFTFDYSEPENKTMFHSLYMLMTKLSI